MIPPNGNIVVMDFDCYTGDRGSIPTHGDSLDKWRNLRPGQPRPCEGNWVVSQRCWRDIDIVSIIAKMGFSASCNSTIYTFVKKMLNKSLYMTRLLRPSKVYFYKGNFCTFFVPFFRPCLHSNLNSGRRIHIQNSKKW